VNLIPPITTVFVGVSDSLLLASLLLLLLLFLVFSLVGVVCFSSLFLSCLSFLFSGVVLLSLFFSST
jgi:hypothetical protein